MRRAITTITLILVFCTLISSGLAANGGLVSPTSLLTDSEDTKQTYITDWPRVEATLINQEPDPVEPGQIVEVRILVENLGSSPAKNAMFELVADYPFSLIDQKEQVKHIPTILGRQYADEGYVLLYKVRVDENAVEGENELTLRYKTDRINAFMDFPPFVIRIRTPDAILNVDRVEMGSDAIKPGQDTELSVVLKNYGDSYLKDARLTLGLEETMFSTVGSSNLKVADNIAPGAEVAFDYNIIADFETESKVHRVPLMLSYMDETGEVYERELSLGLKVFDIPQYSVNIEESEVDAKGEKGKVIVSISNVGSSELKFLTLTLLPSEEYAVLSTPEVYLGNLESDDFETGSYELYIDGDAATLKAEITYKDPFNNEYSDIVDVPMQIYDKSQLKKYQLAENGGVGKFIFIVILLVVAYLVYRRWEKKRKAKKK